MSPFVDEGDESSHSFLPRPAVAASSRENESVPQLLFNIFWLSRRTENIPTFRANTFNHSSIKTCPQKRSGRSTERPLLPGRGRPCCATVNTAFQIYVVFKWDQDTTAAEAIHKEARISLLLFSFVGMELVSTKPTCKLCIQ